MMKLHVSNLEGALVHLKPYGVYYLFLSMRGFQPVVHLDVHLENQKNIYSNNDNLKNQIENSRNTTRMTFLKLCQEDDSAKTLLRYEVALYYIFDKQNNIFNKQKIGRRIDGYVEIFSRELRIVLY